MADDVRERADREERLIAAIEHQANSIDQLVQELRSKRARRASGSAQARRGNTRDVVITEQARALAKAALRRHGRV